MERGNERKEAKKWRRSCKGNLRCTGREGSGIMRKRRRGREWEKRARRETKRRERFKRERFGRERERTPLFYFLFIFIFILFSL